MTSLWREITRPLGVCSIVAAVLAGLIPPSVVVSVSQELIALFGLLLAGALPTMILTATILRAGVFSPKRVGQYGDALERQLEFWFSLFIWAVISCISITIAKALWDEESPYFVLFPEVPFSGRTVFTPVIEATRSANVILGVSATQVMLRLLPMLDGLKSLLRLNSLIATEEAIENARQKNKGGREKVSEIRSPLGHGTIVED